MSKSYIIFQGLLVLFIVILSACVPIAPAPNNAPLTQAADIVNTVTAPLTAQAKETSTHEPNKYAAVFARTDSLADKLAATIAARIKGNITVMIATTCEKLVIDHKTFRYKFVVMVDDVMHDVTQCAADFELAARPETVPIILLGHWTDQQITKWPQQPNWPANTQLLRRTGDPAHDAETVLNYLELLK